MCNKCYEVDVNCKNCTKQKTVIIDGIARCSPCGLRVTLEMAEEHRKKAQLRKTVDEIMNDGRRFI